ncbi:MAG: MBL fold metallo-hydrolase [Bacteroidales bacterium]|nr:MBL fold metallo-hydrolase [Bacteroidales bacterium]
MNMQIYSMQFNDFLVNTYIVIKDNKCLIIDPGCYGVDEQKKFTALLTKYHLSPVAVLITHPHLDHMMGVPFLTDSYSIPTYIHQAGLELYQQVHTWSSFFGINIPKMPEPVCFVQDQMLIDSFAFNTLYVPGHADGSVCYFFPEIQSLFTGDVLFAGSIGRTDLPTGNYDVLMNSLRLLIESIPPETKVYPGHGPSTTLKEEIQTNPFLTDLM